MNNQEQWNQFIKENRGSFLQSWQWGQLQESMNRKIWRVETEGLKGLVVKHNISLGKNYLYCPHGPIGPGDINIFLDKVKEIAKQENSIFFKLESKNNLPFKELGLIRSSKDIQFAKTVILDINKPEDELLSQMHQKTRYNIRLAEKKGIEVIQSNNQESLDIFIKLLKETSQRDKFFMHPQEYYIKIMDILGRRDMVKLFLAKYRDKVIAANLVVFFNKTAVYMHGASDYKHRQLMAPYLLQWQIIKQARELDLKYYDFWGIDEDKWPGVTRFKKGFNGKGVNYPGAYDLAYNKLWYWVYRIARKVF